MNRHVVWWNVQRLFGPTVSPLSRALDATPAQGWTVASYRAKVRNVAAVLRHVCGGQAPVLLTLAEISDAAVTRALLAEAGWPQLKVAVDLHADLAGDDLQVAYDPSVLTLDRDPVSHTVHNRFATRDIYELVFRVRGAHRPLVVLTNHWPSRIVSNSPALRIAAGDYLRRLVERWLLFDKAELITATGKPRMPSATALRERAETPVLVLGDFNDCPYDVSITDVAGSRRERAAVMAPLRFPVGRGRLAVNAYLRRRARLYNPTWLGLSDPDSPGGTAYWNGDWYMLDQVMLSRGLLTGPAPRYCDGSLRIPHPATVPLPDGTALPFCSRGGVPRAFDARAQTGVADHLPLSFELEL